MTKHETKSAKIIESFSRSTRGVYAF